MSQNNKKNRNRYKYNKNYNYNSYANNHRNKTNNNYVNNKKTSFNNDNKKIENTTRIRIDKSRLNDYETLDTSFLDGSKKVKIDNNDIHNSKDDSSNFNYKVILLLLVVVIAILIFIIVNVEEKEKIVEKTKIVEKVKVDDNYLFLGDSITQCYKLEDYYPGKPVVNSAFSGYTTRKVLENMKEMVYDYNPSKVFILIGTNDFIYKMSNEETLNNIEKIINKIKKNRPYCEIYLESIYPINDGDDDKINHKMVSDKRDNETIIALNKELKKIAEEENITYINLYDDLLDDDGNLDIDYTTDGLHISDDGYEVITNKIKKYIKE